MNKKQKSRLHESLAVLPQIDPVHLAETKSKARELLTKADAPRPIGFGSFMLRQICLSGYRAWLWQGLCLILQCLWVTWYFSGNTSAGYSTQFGFALGVFGGMMVLSGIPYVERSWNHRMQEVELSCYYSLPRLLLARLFVIALGNLPCVGVLSLLVARLTAHTDMTAGNGISFLLLSYLAAALGCIFIIDHLHGRGSTLLCYTWTVLVSAGLSLLWRQLPSAGITWLLPFLCILLLALLLWETAAMLKYTKTLDTVRI